MQRFNDILCVVVPGSDNRVALERAASLAESNQACLIIVKVIDDEIPTDIKLLNRAL